MKKAIVAVAALMFLAGGAFADLNVKVGMDPVGWGHLDYDKGSDKDGNSDFSGSAAVEYLYPVVGNMLKVGGGVEYLLPREIDVKGDPKVSFLPVYASIQVNPLQKYAPEVFVKGNVGYAFLIDLDLKNAKEEEGGLYFAFGTGYEFDFGLILEATYSFYYGSWESKPSNDVDFSYSKLGINVGYKFKI